MKTLRNRPIIESTDAPLVVDHALRASVGYWNQHMPQDQAAAWNKIANDAWEALHDGFSIVDDEVYRPQGEALLYMNPDQLELALVIHGCELLDQKPPGADADVLAIDGLLKQIDHIKAQR